VFTLIRPICAVLLAIFAYHAAGQYQPLYDPEANMGNFPLWTAGVGAVVGWVFVGGGIGRALWYSAYMAVQGVALTGVATAMLMAVREVFVLGYRRRYPEVMDAFTGYFDLIVGWLGKAVDRDFLILLGVGGVAIGLVAHTVWALLERRRNDR